MPSVEGGLRGRAACLGRILWGVKPQAQVPRVDGLSLWIEVNIREYWVPWVSENDRSVINDAGRYDKGLDIEAPEKLAGTDAGPDHLSRQSPIRWARVQRNR